MKIGKFLTMAALPMAFCACSSDNTASAVTPESSSSETSSSSVRNLTQEELENWTKDVSKVWEYGGSGTAEDPFQIATAEDLRNIALYVNDSALTLKEYYFKQVADIVVTGEWTPIGIWGKGSLGQGNRPFSGHYDGNMKTISGLTVTKDTSFSYAGLFGLVRNAKFSNIVLKAANVSAGSYTGGIAGKADSSLFENCSFEGTLVGGDYVGGIVGEAYASDVMAGSATGSVKGRGVVGGIAGNVQNATMAALTNNATVEGETTVGGVAGTVVSIASGMSELKGNISASVNRGKVTGLKDVGGVVGSLSAGRLMQCGNFGAVVGLENTLSSVGGVLGAMSNGSEASEAFNAGAVEVTKVLAAGGVVGNMKNVSLTNAFNQGAVSAPEGSVALLGGLTGNADGESKITNAYNSGVVSNLNNAGVLIGKAASAAVLTNVTYDKTVAANNLVIAQKMTNYVVPEGMETAQMKTADFLAKLNGASAVWVRDDAAFGGYPYFAWSK